MATEVIVAFNGQEGRVVHRPDNIRGSEWMILPCNCYGIPLCYGATRIAALEKFYSAVQTYNDAKQAGRHACASCRGDESKHIDRISG